MTKKYSTKKALIASVLSLALCFSMLVGTTFAWFTDSVTSAGNIIKSGTLDVSLEHADTALGATDAGWTDASTGAIFNYSNWEPGYTAVKYVKIENEGTLDLKFILNIIPNNAAEAVNLADVIEVYMVDSAVAVDRDALTTDSAAYVGTLTSLMNENDGAAHGVLYADDADKAGNVYEIYTIALKMSPSAGNEYMGKSVGGGFAVQLLATQLASESDSFNNQYDKDADYTASVGTADELKTALAAGGNIVLTADITADNPTEIPAGVTATLDLNGYTFTSANSNVIRNYGTLTITNGVLDATTAYTVNNAGGNVTIKNVKSVDAGFYNAGTMLVEDCEITNTISGRHGLYNNANSTLVINGLVCSTTAQNAIIYNNNGKVTVNDGAFTQIGSSYMLDGSNITINGGTFTDDDGTWAIRGSGHAIKGGTFNFNPTSYVAPGYQVTDNGDGTYTVGGYEISTGAELVDAIANGKAVELTQDVNLSKIDLTGAITNDVVIDANGHKITTTDAYGIEVTAGKNVTISNANVEMTKAGDYITYAAGFKIANGDYAGATITLENCTITMANTDWAYAVTMPASVKNLNLVIDNCILEGAIAVQCWGDNNTITITNSKLICNYTTNALYTSYCVALQGDGTNDSENNTLVIDNCEFLYSGIDNFNSSIYAAKDVCKGNTGNTVTVTNCTYGEKVVAD